MSTDFETIARRAVACPRWRWMGGMQVVHTPPHDGATGYHLRLSQDGYIPASNEYPDLSDPATLGCLLALVREAWGKPDLHARPEGRYWRMWASEPSANIHLTEAAALVAALEAAP